MTRHTTSHSIVALLSLALLLTLSFAGTVSASEVTGTLSSDGSSGPTEREGMGAAIMNVDGDASTRGGTVVGGSDPGGETPAPPAAVLWSLPLILLAVILIAVIWRRRSGWTT